MQISEINHCSPHFDSSKSFLSQIQISISNFAFSIVKSGNIIQRSVSQENAVEKAKIHGFLFTRL